MEVVVEEEESKKEGGGGAPGWVVTFSDLMSLLLAFFVLLFSFSEVDSAKYKQVGGSLEEAFGVQRLVRLKDPIKGINFIAAEFSSGYPDMKVLNVVPQEHFMDSLEYDLQHEKQKQKEIGGATPYGEKGGAQASKIIPKGMELGSNGEKGEDSAEQEWNKSYEQMLMDRIFELEQKVAERDKFFLSIQKHLLDNDQSLQDLIEKTAEETSGKGKEGAGKTIDLLGAGADKGDKAYDGKSMDKGEGQGDKTGKGYDDNTGAGIVTGGGDGEGLSDAEKKVQEEVRELRQEFAEEIKAGILEIEAESHNLILRINQNATFAPGSAEFVSSFTPIVVKIREAIGKIDGDIEVAGHTDNIPVTGTGIFRSNWDLSSARAISVLEGIREGIGLEKRKFHAVAYGDTRPIADNSTREGRAENRRVEIIVKKTFTEDEIFDVDKSVLPKNRSTKASSPGAAKGNSNKSGSANVSEPRKSGQQVVQPKQSDLPVPENISEIIPDIKKRLEEARQKELEKLEQEKRDKFKNRDYGKYLDETLKLLPPSPGERNVPVWYDFIFSK